MTIILTKDQKTLSKYFTANEVSIHNSSDDIWVSYLGKVYDLTKLIAEYKSDVGIKPILAAAGKDISHWFDAENCDLRTHIDPETGLKQYYCPHGRLIHVPPPTPDAGWNVDLGKPWWRDNKYELGILTKKSRKVRIVNTMQ